VVEYLTHSHKFEGLNLATAVTGGRKMAAKVASGSSTVVENLTHGHKFGDLNTAAAFTGGNKKRKKN
jgi:hypothetical protein